MLQNIQLLIKWLPLGPSLIYELAMRNFFLIKDSKGLFNQTKLLPVAMLVS